MRPLCVQSEDEVETGVRQGGQGVSGDVEGRVVQVEQGAQVTVQLTDGVLDEGGSRPGLVEATARVDGDKVIDVQVQNVPSWAETLDTPIEVREYGTVHADIAFGGRFYVQASAASMGVDLPRGLTVGDIWGHQLVVTPTRAMRSGLLCCAA